MDRPQFEVWHFDEVAFLTLKRRPQFSFVREKVARMVVYTISDEVGLLGHFAIVPGTHLIPDVMLQIFSTVAGVSTGATWFAFRSTPDEFEIVDERDEKFRALCKCIFTDFLMKHALGAAGRPTKLWEYVHGEEGPYEANSDEQRSEREALEARLSDLPAMKQLYKDYNPDTARRIIDALPKAWCTYNYDGGPWGPGIIAQEVGLNSTTTGRYLKAFREAQICELIREVAGVEIPGQHRGET